MSFKCNACGLSKRPHYATGVCWRCYRRALEEPQLKAYWNPPLKGGHKVGCSIPKCPRAHFGKGLCRLHHSKFCAKKRGIIRCKDCRQQRPNNGRGLCLTCWQRHSYNDTLDQFPLVSYKEQQLISNNMYDALEKWIDAGPLNVSELHHRFGYSRRFWEFLKQALLDLKVKFIAGDNYRLQPDLERSQIHEYVTYRAHKNTQSADIRVRRRRKARLVRRNQRARTKHATE